MTDGPSPRGTPLDAAALAKLSSTSVSRIATLTEAGLLARSDDGRYVSGDVHRIRAIVAFEAAGVPLDALAQAQRAGTISLAYYDRLHSEPGALSPRTYAEFADSIGPQAVLLASVFRALGVAEPALESRLSVEDESFMATFVGLIAATGQTDLGLRLSRVFADGIRRAAEASLEIYAEALSRAGDELEGLPARRTVPDDACAMGESRSRRMEAGRLADPPAPQRGHRRLQRGGDGGRAASIRVRPKAD